LLGLPCATLDALHLGILLGLIIVMQIECAIATVDDHWPFSINCNVVSPDDLDSVAPPCRPNEVKVNSGRKPAAKIIFFEIRRSFFDTISHPTLPQELFDRR
jgi:hypothetical protein